MSPTLSSRKRHLKRHLKIEPLEQRTLLAGQGVVSGTVFNDLDWDGLPGDSEPGLADWTVTLQRVGGTDTPEQTFENPTPDEWSQFGRFVAAVDDNVVVGSHYDNIAGPPDAGAAYLFDGASGQLLHILQSPNPAAGDKFGRAVAGLGQEVLVGAPLDDTSAEDAGAVYLFDSQTGQLQRTFLSPSANVNDQFGRAITAVGHNVLVGARFDDRAAEDAGAAYLFDGETGELLQTYLSPTPAENAQFGYAVAAMGDNVLVGARYDETGANGLGAVYLFDGRTGNLLQQFVNPTQRANGDASGFGRSIAAVGDNVLVAARWDDAGVDGAGAAFLFDGATGELLHTLTSPTPFEGEEFGFSVASIGNDALVGARWDNRWDDLGEESGGAAYLFDGVTGQLLQTYANPSAGVWDAFGISVAPFGDQVIVGTRDGNVAHLFDAIAESTTRTTDADGQFSFAPLEPGTYRLLLYESAGFVRTPASGPGRHMVTVESDGSVSEFNFGVVANEPPTGVEDAYSIAEDGVLDLPASAGVLENDDDPEDNPLTVRLVNQAPFGTVSLQPDGSFRYRPEQDFSGSDSFTYRANDGLSDSNLTTVTIDVTPVNDPPEAGDNGLWVLINTPRTVPPPGLLGNDTDADGDALTSALAAAPSHGTVTLQPDGSFTYQPEADYSGPDSFTYRATDPSGESDLATVHVTVSVKTPDELLEQLRITELNYHPYPATPDERAAGFGDREAFEFIELTNTGPAPIDLAGVRLAGAVTFELLDQTLLAPGEYALLVKDRPAFEARYGTQPRLLGQYEGDLHNSGESIQVTDPFERTILDFTYDDAGDWPRWADGFGSSLEVIHPTGGDYNSSNNWRWSAEYGGSPGTAGTGHLRTVVINEVLTHSNLPMTDAVELFNTTGAEIDLSGWFLSDSANDFTQFRIPDGTILSAGGYLVFDEHDFNPERWEPGAGGFAFDSALGDDVWLTAADADGNLSRFVDQVEFGAALNGESFSRWPNGAGELFPVRTVTLGSENSEPRIGPIIISEVMYDPPASAGGVPGNSFEFVEIYNPTTGEVDLRNWRIRGGIDYDFPNSKDPAVEFAPGETLLIVPFHPELDTEAMAAFLEYYAVADPGKMLGPFSGTLDNGGDTVRLMRADAPAWWEPDIIPHVLEDEIPYDNEDPWPVASDGDSLYRRGIDRWGPDPASWGAAAPSPGAVDLQAGTLAITEVNYHPYDPTPAELAVEAEFLDEDFEFVELLNIAGTVVDLSGMWLSDAVGFDFPDAALDAGQRAVVVSNVAAFQARYGTDIPILGQFDRHLGGSERINLVGSSGQTLLSFRYSDEQPWPGRADGKGSSLELIDVFSDYGDADSWRASTEYGGSPGTAGAGPIGLVVINEVFTDRADPANDRIELFNRARGPIDISGWTLSNSGNDPARYRIPEGTELAAHGYVTFDGADLASPQHGTGFAVDPYGQNDLYLLQTDTMGRVTHFADHVQFGASAEGESWGRWPSGHGDLYPMTTPTFDPESGENSGPRVGPVVISELMYHPRDPGDLVEQNDLEYVEIYNPTDQPIDLTGWQLDGGVTFSFDDGMSLAPREALIVVRFDLADEALLDLFRRHYGIKSWVDIVGGYSGSLSNRGESVRLLRAEDPGPNGPEPVLILLEDEVRYDDEAPWPVTADGFGHSLNRDSASLWGNDVVSWNAAAPSPGMVEPRVSTLAVTELNYDPYDPTPAELAVDPSWTRDDFEFIELLNVSGEQLDLAGIRFAEGVAFDFPNQTLAPAERMLLVKNLAAFEQRYGPSDVLVVSSYDDTLSDTGERISLLDGTGEALLRFTYGSDGHWADRAAGLGSSLDLVDLAGYYNDPDNWRASGPYGGTPGSVGQGLRGDVVVNEVLANTDDPLLDAVELFNTTDQAIDIGGWTLSNNSDNYAMFQIPDGTTIAAHGYAVFDGTELFTTGGIDLDGQGDRLWLLAAAGDTPIRFVDDVQFGMAAPGRSFGRWPDGHDSFLPLVSPTLDPDHPEQGANNPAQVTGSLVVTELNYNPYEATPEEQALGFWDGAFEFIELYNVSPFPYDLTGLRFTEGIEFDFDQGSILEIGPRQFVIVAKDVAAFEARYGTGLNVSGPYQRRLSDKGERVVLTTQFGETVFDVSYDDVGGWSNWADGYGTSLELVDPEAVPPPGNQRTEFLENPVHWRPSGRVGGSPGSVGEGPRGGVLINEILISASQPNAVELINTTEDPVDIGGWFLNSEGQQQGYEIPADTWIPSGGYFTFDAEDLGIPLDAGGGSLWLLDNDQPESHPRIVDGAVFGATIDGEALGRWPDGQGGLTPMLQPTVGDENAGPRIGPLIISELHYHSREEGDRDDLEFIEIFNPTSEPVQVLGWQIQGGVKHWINVETPIEPFGTLVILSFNPASDRNADRRQNFFTTYGLDESVLLDGGYKGRLSNGGEKIQLLRSDGTLQDEVVYDDQAPWPIQADGRGRSLNRVRTNLWGNDPGSWVAAPPSPGAALLRAGQGGTEGDMDLNGTVDHSDITDFVMGLVDPQEYFFNYGLPPAVYGDTDGDGDLDFDDIPGFVALLTGGRATLGSVSQAAKSERPDVGPFARTVNPLGGPGMGEGLKRSEILASEAATSANQEQAEPDLSKTLAEQRSDDFEPIGLSARARNPSRHDADYEAFERVLADGLEKHPVDLFA